MLNELNEETIRSLCNPYLLGGHKKDEINIAKLTIAKGIVKATIQVNFVFFESRMKYHFSSIPAYIWAQQFCTIYANWDNAVSGYSYILENTLKFHQFITKKCFDIEMQVKSRKTGPGTFYKVTTNFDDGKIIGSGKFLFSPQDLVV